MGNNQTTKPSNKPLAKQEKRRPVERRVSFDALEAWLKVLTDEELDYKTRVMRLQGALVWVLGKDSKMATDLMTKWEMPE